MHDLIIPYLKTCTKCKKAKPESAFSRQGSRRHSHCKDCRREYKRALYRPAYKVARGPNELRMFETHAALVLTDRDGIEVGECLISLVDVDRIIVFGYRWCKDARGYASTAGRVDYKMWRISMHRWIIDAPDPRETSTYTTVDHINRNRLDNRRENLRVVPHSVNIRNQARCGD